MALIKCSECEKEVSDKAPACVHCGCPIEVVEITVNEEKKDNATIESETEREIDSVENDSVVDKEESITKSTDDASDENEKTTKPKKNRKPLIIGIAGFLFVAIISIALWYFMIKVPYDEAVANFDVAVEEYNIAVLAFEEKNQGLSKNPHCPSWFFRGTGSSHTTSHQIRGPQGKYRY